MTAPKKRPTLAVVVAAEDSDRPGADPLADYLDGFVLELEGQNRSPHTIESYRDSVHLFARFLRADRRPVDPQHWRRQDVQAFIRHLLKTRAPATAANRFRSLQAFCKWLLKVREISASPMADMEPPSLPQMKPPLLKESELKRLFKSIHGDDFEARRDRAIFELLLRTGARRSELADLHYSVEDGARSDVDLKRRLIRVMGKGRREREVALDPKAAVALNVYLLARKRHSHAHLPWLWLGHHGGRLTSNGLFQMVKRRGQAAGIAVHPHAFRHAFADEFLRQGGQESDLMENAGWASQTMVRRYAAASRAERAQLARRRITLFENV